MRHLRAAEDDEALRPSLLQLAGDRKAQLLVPHGDGEGSDRGRLLIRVEDRFRPIHAEDIWHEAVMVRDERVGLGVGVQYP